MSYKGEQDEPTEDRGVGYPVAYRTFPHHVTCEAILPESRETPPAGRAFIVIWSEANGQKRVTAYGANIATAQARMRRYAEKNNLPIWA